MIKSILAIGLFLAFSAPAIAGEYYIVHGKDRHCRVVERLSNDGDIIRVGPLSFGDRDEAERQVKIVCRDNGYYREHEQREERSREERREEPRAEHKIETRVEHREERGAERKAKTHEEHKAEPRAEHKEER